MPVRGEAVHRWAPPRAYQQRPSRGEHVRQHGSHLSTTWAGVPTGPPPMATGVLRSRMRSRSWRSPTPREDVWPMLPHGTPPVAPTMTFLFRRSYDILLGWGGVLLLRPPHVWMTCTALRFRHSRLASSTPPRRHVCLHSATRTASTARLTCQLARSWFSLYSPCFTFFRNVSDADLFTPRP